MTSREDAHLMSGSYALDALSDDERALVEDAMRHSEELRGEVVGLGDTAVVLGLSVPPSAPPSALRSRLLAAIEQLPQEHDEPDQDSRLVALDAHVPVQPVPASTPTGMHLVPRRRPRVRRPAVALVLVAVAALLFGGGFLVQRTLLEPQSELSALQQAPDHVSREGAVAGGGTVTVLWSTSEHRTAVLVNGASAPSGKVLQLWSVRGSTITSAGLYTPEGGNHFVVIGSTPSAGEKLAVTVEPAGGSTRPTSDPIATVSL